MKDFYNELTAIAANDHHLKRYVSMINHRLANPTESQHTELHHILPRSLFPDYSSSDWNIVVVSLREHYILHIILAKALEDSSMWRSVYCMSNFKKYIFGVSSKVFESSKIKSKLYMSGINHPNHRGVQWSEEARIKRSKEMTNNQYALGSRHNNGFKLRQSKRYRGKSYEERHGEEKAKQLKHQRSLSMKEVSANRDYADENNPKARKCLIEDQIFNTVKEVMEYYNFSRQTVTKRLNSDNYPDWQRVS